MAVRLARPEECELLPSIEDDAGKLFAEVGMVEIANGTNVPAEKHREAQARGELWVAIDDRDRPVGFANVEVRDACAFLKELAVHPSHGKRGLGRELVETVAAWAKAKGYPALTLTTFRDVPWNGPWYRRCGFRDLREDEITPQLRQVRDNEIAAGLDKAGPRLAMRREL